MASLAPRPLGRVRFGAIYACVACGQPLQNVTRRGRPHTEEADTGRRYHDCPNGYRPPLGVEYRACLCDTDIYVDYATQTRHNLDGSRHFCGFTTSFPEKSPPPIHEARWGPEAPNDEPEPPPGAPARKLRGLVR